MFACMKLKHLKTTTLYISIIGSATEFTVKRICFRLDLWMYGKKFVFLLDPPLVSPQPFPREPLRHEPFRPVPFGANRFDPYCFDHYRFESNRFDPNHFDANHFDPYRFDPNWWLWVPG
ncbi:hypothetical protein Hanom_Chr03g00272761 [Helianthus anomalus]